MFYTYYQNNSGGRWDDGGGKLSSYVIVEAENADDANRRAQRLGIYFNGVSDGSDCSCCGNRWREAWSDEGKAVPAIYGQPLSDYFSPMSEYNQKYPSLMFSWNVNPKGDAVVYYLDGHEEWFGESA